MMSESLITDQQENMKHIQDEMAFWDNLTRPRYIVAPMVDLGELAFRMMCRHYNAQLAYTPMLNSGQFASSSKYREFHFQTDENDHPLFAQFCGNNPQTMLNAALYIEDQVEAIDINLGCPQGIARRGNYGSFLLQQPDIIISILSHLKRNLKIPVTCKIRKVSEDLQQTLNLCYQLEANGCSALCIHGRTKEEKAQQVDACDWESIRIIKEKLQIPIIANGGVESFEELQNCLFHTKADAIMSAEGILDYPALFTGKKDYGRLNLAEEYLSFAKKFPPNSNSCIRAHLFKILHGHLQQSPEIRDLLVKAKMPEDFFHIIDRLRIKNVIDSDVNTWYRRYRHNTRAMTTF